MNARKYTTILIACMTLPGCVSPDQDRAAPDINSLLGVLRDQSASDDAKREAGSRIEACGKDAIPVLIKNLDDEVVCFPKCPVRSLPLHPPPGMRTTYAMTVGSYCKGLLESIITHPDDPTYTYSKHMPFMVSVEDWSAWWQANSDKSLR